MIGSLSRVLPRRRSVPLSDTVGLSLALLPPAVVVTLIHRYSVDVPFWDQWELVPLLERYCPDRGCEVGGADALARVAERTEKQDEHHT